MVFGTMKNVDKVLENAFFLCLLVIAVLCVFWLLYRAEIGPDISDGSYYILNQLRPETLHIQLQQFGTIWKALIGNHSIVLDRMIHILLFFTSTAVLSYHVISAMIEYKVSPFFKAGFSLFPASFALCYFIPHLPDFSYNSGTYLGVLTVLSSILILSRRKERILYSNSWSFWFWSGLLGFGFTVLGLVKPPSAVLLFLTTLTFFFLFERHLWDRQSIIKLILAVMIGLSVLILMIAIQVKSPWQLFSDMLQGFESMIFLKAHNISVFTQLSKLLNYFHTLVYRVFELAINFPIGFFFGLFVVLAPLFFRFAGFERFRAMYLAATLILAIMALFFLWPTLTEVSYKVLQRNLHIGHFWLLLIAFVGLGCLPISVIREKGPWLMLLVFSFIFARVGTANQQWALLNYMYMGLTATAVTAIIMASHEKTRSFAIISLIFVLGWFLPTAILKLEKYPYGLSPLADATVRLDFGDLLGSVRMAPKDAEPFLALESFREKINKIKNKTGKQIALVDLSGHAPGLALFLGMDTGPIAWNINRELGSPDYLRMGLKQFSDESLSNAWVVVSNPNLSRLNTEVFNMELERIGKNFPRDYREKSVFQIPYINSTAQLFIPTSSLE